MNSMRSQVALVVKNPPAMQETKETRVQSLGREDPLEVGMATRSSIPAWRIPMDRGAWQATVHGVAESLPRLKRPSRRMGSLAAACGIQLSNRGLNLGPLYCDLRVLTPGSPGTSRGLF